MARAARAAAAAWAAAAAVWAAAAAEPGFQTVAAPAAEAAVAVARWAVEAAVAVARWAVEAALAPAAALVWATPTARTLRCIPRRRDTVCRIAARAGRLAPALGVVRVVAAVRRHATACVASTIGRGPRGLTEVRVA
jgi:hypothetical protein